MQGQRLICGPFELDPVTQLVHRDGQLLPLGSRGALLLYALFQRPGEVLTKTELMDAAWPETAVEESNLTVQIASLRKALGSAENGTEWIVTVPRIGYRFVGQPAPPIRPDMLQAENRSIAVLPFVNLSSDPEQAFFADGLAEEIIVALGKLPGLVVIARNSSFAYRGSDLDVRKVGSDLDVRYIVSGSVRRGGTRLRVSAQLAETEGGAHIWAETFDREVADVFAIQDEVTRQIVDALKLKLTPSEAARATSEGTTDLEALDLMLRGRALLGGATQNLEVFKRTIDLLKRAIDRDPSYVEAYNQLAVAYVFDYMNRWTDDPDRSLKEAQSLADRALAIAPNEAGPHNTAALAANFSRDFDRFRRETETAIALNPNYPGVHHLRGMLCLSSGDPLGAVPYFERVMRLDPSLSTTMLYLQLLGVSYFYAGRYETAVALFRERILLMPDTDWSRAYLASALGHLGRPEEAQLVWKELMALNPNYALAERLYRGPTHPNYIEMVLDGARKAGLPA
jgi:TolB-like protein